MIQRESSPVSTRRRAPPAAGRRDGPEVVRLRGGYDITTASALAATLSLAISLDDGDLVMDVSEVTFIDAATVGVIVRARVFLTNRSRRLRLRHPSGCVRRILDICDLTSLIEADPSESSERRRGSWWLPTNRYPARTNDALTSGPSRGRLAVARPA